MAQMLGIRTIGSIDVNKVDRMMLGIRTIGSIDVNKVDRIRRRNALIASALIESNARRG
jgi:hypothetical protein